MKNESKDYEAMLQNFNCMIDSKADVINRITPLMNGMIFVMMNITKRM